MNEISEVCRFCIHHVMLHQHLFYLCDMTHNNGSYVWGNVLLDYPCKTYGLLLTLNCDLYSSGTMQYLARCSNPQTGEVAAAPATPTHAKVKRKEEVGLPRW